jgi:hypothetical protein
MFKNLFKKSAKPKETVKEVEVPCVCESGNEHCDLILRLRKYQDLRKELKSEIDILNRNSREFLCYFISFLKKLEENNFKMNSFNDWITSDHNMLILDRTISQYSSGDIVRMTEELRVYRNKADIIYDKQRALRMLEDDIEEIKSKLGIE